MNYKIFFRDLVDSFIPSKYHILIDDKIGQIFKFFFCTLFLFLIVASILFIPKMVIMPFQVEKEFSKFTEFSIDAKITTSDAVNLGFITIDTGAEEIPNTKGLFINNDTLQVNLLPFGLGKNQAKLDDLKDLSRNRRTVKINLLLGMILLLPYIFILIYAYSAIKFLLLALIVGSFVVIATRTLKGVVKARVVLKTALYATPVLMLELLFSVFSQSWYVNTLFPLILYLMFVIIITVILGKEHKVRSHRRRKPKKFEEEEEEEIDPDLFANTRFGNSRSPEKADSVDMSTLQRDLEKNRIR